MLDYGVDPNLANDDGLTALHQVSLIDQFSALEVLLLYKEDTTGSTFDSYFPNCSMFV